MSTVERLLFTFSLLKQRSKASVMTHKQVQAIRRVASLIEVSNLKPSNVTTFFTLHGRRGNFGNKNVDTTARLTAHCGSRGLVVDRIKWGKQRCFPSCAFIEVADSKWVIYLISYHRVSVKFRFKNKRTFFGSTSFLLLGRELKVYYETLASTTASTCGAGISREATSEPFYKASSCIF